MTRLYGYRKYHDGFGARRTATSVEGGICKLPILEMEQLAEHADLESSEYKGKTKLAMSRIVRDKFEVEMDKTERTIEYLKEIWNFYFWDSAGRIVLRE